MHTNGMGRTSKVVNGFPPFYSETYLYGCDVCFNFKTRRTAAVNGNTRRGHTESKSKTQNILGIYYSEIPR